jgi:hypothetical protein
MTRKSPKPAMTVEAIAAALGQSPSAVRLCLSRALLKLRRDGRIITARGLAIELESHRSTEHTMRRPVRGR